MAERKKFLFNDKHFVACMNMDEVIAELIDFWKNVRNKGTIKLTFVQIIFNAAL